MKLIIFAGGSGTRLWPLSRKALPKQFIKMFNGKSTIELAVNRVKNFGYENISIGTLQEYVPLTKKYLPKIPPKNIVGEPALRNLAPAVGYNLVKLRSTGYRGPVAILWADHLIKDEKVFMDTLKEAEKMAIENPDKIIFVGKKARFANNNVGWINFGKKISKNVYEYKDWVYKPETSLCEKIFKSGDWFWNTGYFIMDLGFGIHLYEKYQPEMYKTLCKIEKSLGTKNEKNTVEKLYPTMEKIHFDNAIAMSVKSNEALVIETKMEWSDPGTLYALKEAIVEKEKDNYTKGNIVVKDVEDSVVINEEKSKLLVAMGIKGMAVVNTNDVALVIPKEKVKDISELLADFGKDSKYRKYL